MRHILNYQLKCFLRNKSILFWTLAFPIILTTMFSLVLTDIYKPSSLKTMELGVIDTASYQSDVVLQEVLTTSKNGDSNLFNVTLLEEEEAKTLLSDGKLSAYVTVGDELRVHVSKSGIEQTIIESFFDEYLQKQETFNTLLAQGTSVQRIQELFTTTTSAIERETSDNSDLSSVYFYAALAMNAIFGGYWTINSMYYLLANQSTQAARFALAPVHKAKLLLCNFITTISIHTTLLAIVLAYICMVLKVDFGEHFGFVILTLFTGGLAGNALGVFIGCFIGKTSDVKSGTLTAVTMFCSFLAGLMSVEIKYLVQENIPILAYINPVTMITDSLYALYYYGVSERFVMNIVSLLLFTIVCYSLSYAKMRKKQYKSMEVSI